jgi:type II secretory pathway component PulJ
MKSRGFTIIEILTVIAITITISGVLFAFQRNIFYWNNFLSNSLISQDEARRAFKVMSSELRSMAPSSTGAYALVQAATSSVTFYANIDSDAVVERVRYYVSGNTLKRGVLKPSGNPLAYTGTESTGDLLHSLTSATSTIFSYYNSNYDGTTAALSLPVDVAAVRLVKIQVSADADINRAPTILTFTTQISLRNLKDNL